MSRLNVWTTLVFALLFATACTHAPLVTDPEVSTDAAKVDRLLHLIGSRFQLVEEIARNTWTPSASTAEVTDNDIVLLQRFEATLANAGADKDLAISFYKAQLSAGRVIRNARWRAWLEQRRPPFAVSADADARLAEVDQQIVPALNDAIPALRGRDGGRLLRYRVGRINSLVLAEVDARDLALSPLTGIAR